MAVTEANIVNNTALKDDLKKKKRKRTKKNKDKHPSEEQPDSAADGEEVVEEMDSRVIERDSAEKKRKDRDEEDEDEEGEEEKDDEEEKKVRVNSGSGIMTTQSFETLPISDLTLNAIKDMNFQYMTETRQTALFSATQTNRVQDLARLSFQTTPFYIDVDDGRKKVTNEGLQQGYCIVPSAKRFALLLSFLKRNHNKKVMVFFSSCNSVKFHSELLRYISMDCFDIHGKQKQQKCTTTFFDFCKAEKGFLLCTDVAARGLDIPAVDWILQYDPPDDPKEYIHRVGRTVRGEGAKGNALLFLIPEEMQFLNYLKKAKVPVKEYEFDPKRIINARAALVETVSNNYYLNKSAKDAYRSYLLSYNSHSMKDIFNIHLLDLQAVATSFCFTCPPKVNLNLDSGASKFRRTMHKIDGKHGFSESKSDGDTRQFVRY